MLAVEFKTYARGTALFGQDPGARDERRIVTHMLAVTALQIGAPVAVLILMKACNPAFHTGQSLEVERT